MINDSNAGLLEEAPRVSIIMPTYQHEAYVESAIRSVLAQTLPSWELIVIDDASSDRTADIVKHLAASDRRIRLIRHQSNYGAFRLSETYNEALAQCRGELIAILEGDDEWSSDKLARQVPVFADQSVVLSYADYDEVTTDGLLIARHGARDAISAARSGPRDNLQFFATLTSFGSNTVMVRKHSLQQTGGFRSVAGIFVDFPTWLNLVPRGDFVRVPGVLGRWRRHPGSVAYASYQLGTLQQLERYFVAFVLAEHDQLAALGIEESVLQRLVRQAGEVLQDKQKSAPYYEGKYHLMFGKRLKAMGRFCRALLDPGTAPRHRIGALVGVTAALSSRRLLPYVSRLTHEPGSAAGSDSPQQFHE